jgi:hypothetical protein
MKTGKAARGSFLSDERKAQDEEDHEDRFQHGETCHYERMQVFRLALLFAGEKRQQNKRREDAAGTAECGAWSSGRYANN